MKLKEYIKVRYGWEIPCEIGTKVSYRASLVDIVDSETLVLEAERELAVPNEYWTVVGANCVVFGKSNKECDAKMTVEDTMIPLDTIVFEACSAEQAKVIYACRYYIMNSIGELDKYSKDVVEQLDNVLDELILPYFTDDMVSELFAMLDEYSDNIRDLADIYSSESSELANMSYIDEDEDDDYDTEYYYREGVVDSAYEELLTEIESMSVDLDELVRGML